MAAEAIAQRARLAMARFAYRQAARWVAEAAQLMSETRFEQARAYQDQAASALYKHGEELDDNDALREAVAAYREAREAFLGAWNVFRGAEDNRFDDYFIGRIQMTDDLLGDPPADS